MGKDLSQLPFFAAIQENFSLLQELVEDPKLLEEVSLTISVHGLGEEQLGYLFYFNTHEAATQVLLGTIANKIRASKDYSSSIRKYAGYKVKEIGQHKYLSYIKHNQYIIASFSSLLVEDVIRGLSSKAPSGLLRFKKTANKQGSLYVNLSQLPQVLRPFVKGDLFSTLSTTWATFTQSSQLELKLANHHLLLSGFTKDQGAAQQYFTHILDGQSAGAMMLAPYLPQSTAVLQHFTFSDAEQLFATLKQYRAMGPTHTTKKSDTSLLAPTLYPLLKGEIGCCTLEAKHSHKEGQLVFIKVSNPQAFIEALTSLHLLTSLTSQASGQSVTPFKLQADCFQHWLPGQLFPDFEAHYITQVEDYIVLANSQLALQTWYTQYQQGKTWAKAPAQNVFLESTLDQAHFSLFIDLPKAWPQILRLLKPTWQQVLEAHAGSLHKFLHASLQLLHEQDTGCYMSILLKHKGAYPPPKNQEQQLEAVQERVLQRSIITSMSFQAEAPIITQPWVVKSHRGSGHYVLLQDAQHQLYFLDRTGKLLWKKNLEGPITTGLFEVDFYKNNKIQYLFATATHLHLLDYYGRKVGKYPYLLPQSDKPVHLHVVDDNKDKHYRLLVATARGEVYLKDSHYKPLPAWNPQDLQQSFAVPPFHRKIQGKDYFMALQENGILQVLNPKGQSYPGFPVDLKAAMHNPLFISQGKAAHDTSLVVLTDAGKRVQLNLAGEVQESLQLYQAEATTRFVLCPDSLTGRKYVIMRQNADKVAVMDESEGLIFEHPIKAQRLILQYYDFGGSYQFYVLTDLDKQLTYLYDHTGKLIHNVPLRSSHKVKLSFSEEERSLYIHACFEHNFSKQVLTLP